MRENLPIEVKFSRWVVEDADPYGTISIRPADLSGGIRYRGAVLFDAAVHMFGG